MQAWAHLQKVEGFTIGRPCTSSCKYNSRCGIHIAPALLIGAHQYSYGRSTAREEEGHGGFTYKVEYPKAVTMKKWRELAAAAMSVTNDGNKRRVENLTVCKLGPVCQDYWAAAYGIPKGTANIILAEARSGRLALDRNEETFQQHLIRVTSGQHDADNMASEVTVEWWEMWLSIEDQMPNEATIQHRTLVWQTVYEQEYIMDMEWWGGCRALSRSRWLHLRGVALRNLSIQFFGHVDGKPEEPNAMLSLVQRPSHSNFGMCNACAEAKDKWSKYRRFEN